MRLTRFCRGRRVLAVTAAFLLVLCTLPMRAHATDLEVCRMCGGSGDFHCPNCGNKGEVVCDGCHGEPRTKCPGDGVHGCVDGYYTCPSCNGDTFIRSGDGEIPPDAQPGTCGNCGGTGRLRCIVCHTEPGWNLCTGCDGTGIKECPNGNCQIAKKYGWKCPRCKGTGYILLGNPMPPESDNDGVKNVPKKGDYIVTNNETWEGYRYGEDSQGGGDEPGGQGGQEPGGQGGQEPGGQGGQEPGGQGGDEPGGQGGQEPGGQGGQEPGGQEPGGQDIPQKPEGTQTIEFPAVPKGEAGAVKIEVFYEELNEEQKTLVAAMPAEELQEMLTTTKKIVSTAKPGTAGEGVEDLLEKLAKANGFESFDEARLLPIEFEGHQELPFPVYVTVQLERGALDGGADIYVYHILENGEIEPLEKPEIWTYDDGSIESIRFRTTGFSSFFTAKKLGNIDVSRLDSADGGDPNGGSQEEPQQGKQGGRQDDPEWNELPIGENTTITVGAEPAKNENSRQWLWILIGVAGVCGAGVAAGFLFGRKKSK